MLATFVRMEQVASNYYSFWFKPEQTLDYVAGQFIELTLPHHSPDTRGYKRWFTLSSAPSEQLLSITTKQTIRLGSSFKQALFMLEPGSKATMSEAMGDFVLPKDPAVSILFVAGGTGITPVRSMLKYLLDHQEKRDIKILHIVPSTSQLAFQDIFKAYGSPPLALLSRNSNGSSDFPRHLDAADILKQVQQPDTRIYVSGPEQMVEKLGTELQRAGVPAHRLVLDFYHGYQSI